jgi:hypothetical protein
LNKLEKVPPPLEAARYVTLLAREHTPKAIALLLGILDDKDKNPPEAVFVLREMMRGSEDDRTRTRAAVALLTMQKAAADTILNVARLIEAKLELPHGERSAPGVTVVIQRQGREVTITDERTKQQLRVADELTVEGESVGDRLAATD